MVRRVEREVAVADSCPGRNVSRQVSGAMVSHSSRRAHPGLARDRRRWKGAADRERPREQEVVPGGQLAAPAQGDDLLTRSSTALRGLLLRGAPFLHARIVRE